MADKQQPVQEKKQTKKVVRKQVYERLAGALADYKAGIGEKKFESRLRKASKLFAVDIAKATRKETKLKSKKKNISLTRSNIKIDLNGYRDSDSHF